MKLIVAKSALLFGLMVLLFSACQKELNFPDGPANPTPTGPVPIVLINDPVTLTVNGKVVDENNNPVAGATVSGGGKTTTTVTDGTFSISNGNFNGSFTTVKIEKDNYFTLVKTISTKANQTEFITAKLSPRLLLGKISVTGGTVTFPDNVKVAFPVNAFANSTGGTLLDSVSVYVTYIDPTAADAADRMPGNLMGVVAPSTVYILRSLGMLAVELVNSVTNEPVKLATGKKATITAPIPASLMGDAQATIPMWYFDDAKGVWVKDGEATKTGNSFVGEVSHFTFWNLDYFGPYCNFAVRYVNAADNSALAYSRVTLQITGNSFEFTDYTNSNGSAYGYVPLNTTLQLRFYKADGTVAHDTLIGPFTNDANLGNIFINAGSTPPASSITGVLLNCAGQPVNSGYVTATVNGASFQASVNSTGSFSIPVSAALATGNTITLGGFDSTSNADIPASTITYNGTASLSLGYLFSCANPAAEFITYNLDGTDHIFIRNTDSAFCSETLAFNRTDLACRRANGSPQVEGFVAFLTGPSSVGGTDTSSILTLEQYTTASTPSSLNIQSFTESYSAYPSALGIPGWVTGEFTCVFTDAVGASHTVRSRFKMWRRQF